MPGERLSVAVVAALVLGFGGVALLILGAHGSGDDGAHGALALLAAGAALVGAVCASVNKILAKRLTTTLSAPIMLRDMGFVVAVLTGLAAALLERPELGRIGAPTLLSFIYLGVVASAGGVGSTWCCCSAFASARCRTCSSAQRVWPC